MYYEKFQSSLILYCVDNNDIMSKLKKNQQLSKKQFKKSFFRFIDVIQHSKFGTAADERKLIISNISLVWQANCP